jgi:novobiocin biosynthesis protein NovU/D-mycarose 3-C-methyltransferase
VIELLDFEARVGLQSIAYYGRMQEDAESVAANLSTWTHKALESGALIGGYGASAKGTTLLNFCRLGAAQIFAIADSTPEKQGRFMPGVAIPVLSPAAVMGRNPTFVLVLARNVVDEICSIESTFLDDGGEFVIAIPTLKRFGRTGRRRPPRHG